MGLKTLALFRKNPINLLYLSILLYTTVFSYLAILKHYAFMSTAWDLGIYEQILWSTINTGRLFWYTPEIVINPSCCFFGIHFSPILFLILPVYAIFQTTELLLILQAFFLALGAVPLYKFVFYESHSEKEALVFALLYLGYPPIYGICLFDFHVQAFLPFLFFYVFYYFKKEEWNKYFPFLILTLMVIEFVPLIVMFLGLYGLWVKKESVFHSIKSLNFKAFFFDKKIFFSILTIIIGFVWFIVAMNITKAINPSAPPHPNWANFGDPIHNLPELIFNVLTNPIKTFETLFTPFNQKILYIFGLFAPLAFLSFLDFPSLMIGAPWFVAAFLSNYPQYYTAIGYQYVAFVTPFIFISAFYGLKRLPRIKRYLAFNRQLNSLFNKMIKIRRWKTLMILGLAIILSISYIVAFDIRIELPFVTEHDRLLETFTRLIPANASVLTQNNIFPHLSRRLYAYVGGDPSPLSSLSNIELDYILVDTKSNGYEGFLEELIYNLTENDELGVKYAADGIWLLERGYKGEIIYPIDQGVFVKFFNQGISVKLFRNTSLDGEPLYENVTLSLQCPPWVNFSQSSIHSSFALVFEGWLYVPISGNYFFQLESLGFSSLYLNNTQILYNNGSTTHTAIWLDKGFHSIRVEYINQKCFPFVPLLWKPPWDSSIQEISPMFLYLKNSPDISSMFLETRWNWGAGSPFVLINKNYFTAFINFSLYVPSTGVYKFKILANDCASISINGELLSDPFEVRNQTIVEVLLSEGSYIVQIDYAELQGNANLNVMWQPPGDSEFSQIPLNNLCCPDG